MGPGASSSARPHSALASRPALHETVQEFVGFMQTLPASAFRPKRWGPREVLSHIVFWHETYVRMIAAQLEHQPQPRLEGAFWQLNALAVARFHRIAVAQLLNRLLRAQLRLERLLPEARRRHLRIRLKVNTQARDLEEFLLRVEAHIRGHRLALRRRRRQ